VRREDASGGGAVTGARRSEMLRALAADAELSGGGVTIREKMLMVLLP
jgi:hypothetical protein